MKKALVTALFGSLVFAGCSSELSELPRLSPEDTKDMELVVVDGTDPSVFDSDQGVIADSQSHQRLAGRPAAAAHDMVTLPSSGRRLPPRIDDNPIDRSDAPGKLPDNPCDCQDQGCLSEWVDQNLGCNLCVSFICSDDNMSTCGTCD